MIYSVWHAKRLTFGKTTLKFPEEYDKVAIVRARNIDDVFRITNHINKSWTLNSEIVELLKEPNRSTSVGDIVGDEDGKFYYCNMFGWSEKNIDEKT